ncbi:glycoside hydrolase family 15 protein [Chondromyces crocatus]|uniref:Trehalase n=1 Tax=Chondromyces crocatus TaxID=52 RepID=A0A0K1E9X5_CHOCO|nr:glycoside hydrolase family 15 protein [Chondromyces crocatus]AKT37665.1 glucoamylase [Chondromyces crocatus]
MTARIEDYALIGDTQSAALVGRDGSIDWLCLPRFDSDACFAALLGDERHGRWKIAPRDAAHRVTRRYRPGTLVLETLFETEHGTARLVDCMPPRQRDPDLLRVVEGVSGTVVLAMELKIRFGYGATLPWIRRQGASLTALAGPDALSLYLGRAGITVTFDDADEAVLRAEFTLSAGDQVQLVLVWHPSTEPPPAELDPLAELSATEAWWSEWSAQCTYRGEWREHVLRSLLTLKALTFLPSGGIVAAATTSLPERIGGVRNWDYRFCWLRDATFTLLALMESGYYTEAEAWCAWLLRAVAGHPAQFQIMYGVLGERRLTEIELPWLPGYEGSSPVRIGNAAVDQFQLDVFGEVMNCIHHARRSGIQLDSEAWALQCALLEHLEHRWQEPDEGIWEVRGPRRHFTHSKVMAWVAFDRAIRDAQSYGLPGPVERWQELRAQIHAEVCAQGYDPRACTFTQFYGTDALDASLLMIPLVGFLPANDPRVVGTVDAIQRGLTDDTGLTLRYLPAQETDGLPPGEGAFLACTAWLADCLSLLGRQDEARGLFERLLSFQNDVGLLSEEYDVRHQRFLGNFPQALTHTALVNTARILSRPHSAVAICGGR